MIFLATQMIKYNQWTLIQGLGAKNLNRNYIMMEQDPKYYEIACKRVQV